MIPLLTTTAHAADFDHKVWALDLFASTTEVPDPAFDLFSPNDVLPVWGVRVGGRPAERVELSVAWGSVRRGVTYTSEGFGAQGDVAAITGSQVTLGAKVDASLGDVLLPSLGVHGVALPVRWRFDGDPDHDDDLLQVQARGMPVGAELVAGLEARVPPHEIAALAGWIELGGSVYTRAAFGDLGTLRPGGFVFRGGLGLRF
jgi:hypothetical protein